MKILALVTDGYGGHGGIAQYNRDLTSGLASLESVDSVRILPRAGVILSGSEEPLPSFKLSQEPPTFGRLLYSLRALRLAWRQRPDLIFCGHLYMAPLVWLLAKMLGKPWWLQLHGLEAWKRPGALIRFASERADFVTAVSRYTRRRFLSWASIPPEHVRVLPNTFDPPPPSAATQDELKAKHGLTGRKVLLTVSRIDYSDRYKGHDKVLGVLPSLIESQPGIVYVIVGDGNDCARLQDLVNQAGLTRHVCFAGRVGRDELQDYYRLADVYVMPSTKEGFGIVFLEAASFGLPVIGGNLDGSVDALAEGAIGDGIDPNSASALPDAVKLALSSPTTRKRETERFARNKFSAHLDALIAGMT